MNDKDSLARGHSILKGDSFVRCYKCGQYIKGKDLSYHYRNECDGE